MKKRLLPLIKFIAVLLAVSQLQAVVPRKWELRSREDFLRGKFSGTSLTSDGILSIGPKVEKMDLPTEEFYLSLAKAPDGSFFLGTGHGGKIYRINRDKKAELYFQTAELDVTALAVDSKGVLYAGTSPNGKIYKITGRGRGEEFFNPQSKYIWQLLFVEGGNLLAAVGESGGVYEINPAGAGRLIYRARDNHILCLVKTPAGDLLAGSGGPGRLYKISSSGRASVLFDSGYEEIRNVVYGADGYIYISGSGQPSRKTSTVTSKDTSARSKTETEVSVEVSEVRLAEEIDEPLSIADSPESRAGAGTRQGAVFQIAPDGLAKRLWNSTEEMVYGLIYDAGAQKLIMGTGNRGRLYALDRQGGVELLTQESSEQIFALYQFDKQIHLLGNNPCLFGQLQLGQSFAGEYLSPVLDAGIISSWGRISWEAELPSGASVQVQSRTGNTGEPDDTWSDWSPPYSRPDEKILSPRGRFLQLKVSLKSQSGQQAPRVQRIIVFYLQANVAPVIEKLEVLPPNQVFLKPMENEEVILGLDESSFEGLSRKGKEEVYLSPKKAERQGFRTIKWEASDENQDNLIFNVYVQREGDNVWRLMREKTSGKIFSFDTRNFPDGTYWLKVEASDLPSNPPGTERKTEKVSQTLVIDNAPPQVKNFQATAVRDGLEVSFLAEDSYSYIEEVKYLIKPGDWQVVFPVDGICDSRSESFRFTVNVPAGSDNLLVIRVKDSFGNVGIYQHRF